MGQEIETSHFHHEEFRRFYAALHTETLLLQKRMRDGAFSERSYQAGLELELCLVDASYEPAPRNEEVLTSLQDSNVVMELSKYNLEFNVDPAPLVEIGIATLAHRMQNLWRRCQQVAGAFDLHLVTTGILPTLQDEDLTLQSMSNSLRYRALNEQVLRLRRGKPVRLDIDGLESVISEHRDVMLEAAATSFQLHLQVPFSKISQALNWSTILSAPLVAISANSPLLFHRPLWSETRIPLFEQAVSIAGPIGRVTLGTGYVKDVHDCFLENQSLFPVLLPIACSDQPAHFSHVKLHNGTIWRWNRPILGNDPDGTPHVRLEQRVMPAGPSMLDMEAQMAFFYGLMIDLLEGPTIDFDERLPFLFAWDNFYQSARMGLRSSVHWIDGKKWPVVKLMHDVLVPAADRGLGYLGVDATVSNRWLGIITDRMIKEQNGATWQLEFWERSGRDPNVLVREYVARQATGEPVHTWSL